MEGYWETEHKEMRFFKVYELRSFYAFSPSKKTKIS